MNTKQKRQIFIVLLISVLTVLMSLKLCFADGSMDTQDSSSTVKPNKNQGTAKSKVYVDGADRTGTRYVIRVEQEDGTFADIGGEFSQYFYLNHVYKANIHNYEFDDGKKESAYDEMMMAGASGIPNGSLWKEIKGVGSGMDGYTELKTAKSIFATHASSSSEYQDEDSNGNPQYRHIIKWSGNVDASNFGLTGYYENGTNNTGDIDVLLGYIEQVADILSKAKNGREIEAAKVKEQVAAIRNGDLNIEVRAEVLIKVRYLFKATSLSVYKDVYAKAKNTEAALFYTYKDAMALGGVNEALFNRAKLLYEKHPEKMEEYKNDPLYDISKENDNYKYLIKVQEGNTTVEALAGFDYLYEAGNPYVTNIIEEARNIDTGELITSFGENGTREKKFKGTGTQSMNSPVPGNDGISDQYIYEGLQLNGNPEISSIDPSKTTVEVDLDKGKHIVTYWYKESTDTTIVRIKYREENGTTEGAKIPGYDDKAETITSENTYSAPTITGYDYTGLEVIQPNKADKVTDTSITIQIDNQTHEIIFWYKKQPDPISVTIKYREDDGTSEGKKIPGYEDKAENISKSNIYFAPNIPGYEYVGLEEIKPEKKDRDDRTFIRIEVDDKAHEIIFWYERRNKVDVYYVQVSNDKIKSKYNENTKVTNVEKFFADVEGKDLLSPKEVYFRDWDNLASTIDKDSDEFLKSSDEFLNKLSIGMGSMGDISSLPGMDSLDALLSWDGTGSLEDIMSEEEWNELIFGYVPIDVPSLDDLMNASDDLLLWDDSDYLESMLPSDNIMTIEEIERQYGIDMDEYVAIVKANVSDPSQINAEELKNNLCALYNAVNTIESMITTLESLKAFIPSEYEEEFDNLVNKGKILVTEMSDLNNIIFRYADELKELTFSKNAVKQLGNQYQYIRTYVDGVYTTTEDALKIVNDGNDHEVIFCYVEEVEIRVIGVCEETYETITFVDNEKLPLGSSKTYEPVDWSGYTYINKYSKQYGSFTYEGRELEINSDDNKTGVKIETNMENNPGKILIIFYYDVPMLTIKHVDEASNELLDEEYKISLAEAQEVFSRTYDGYTNSRVALDGTDITPSGIGSTKDIYSVIVEPGSDGNDRELIFYYKKQKLVVKHEYVDGTPIKNPEYVDVPTEQSKLEGYPYYGNKLNNVPGTDPTVYVDINPEIHGDQELVFLYVTPALIFGESDPNPNPHYPNGENYGDIRERLEVGLWANDLNNQYVKEDTNMSYWVLDEKGELTYRFAMLHIDSASVSAEVEAYIPFDVYINGVLYRKNTKIIMTYQKAGEKGGYDIYEGKIANIHVPIWVDEAEYDIKVSIRATTVFNGVSSQSNWGTETAKVTVVGRIYDFSVTNIQGDDIWKTSLFTTYKTDNGEHEADTLPIGQNKQQNSKYLYGIKQGSKIFFSVNTKGSANTGIKILPEFYYIDKDGNWVGKVNAYSKNQEITTIDLARSSAANDSYRVTQEYRNELVTARTVYSDVKYDKSNIGNYARISLGSENRTPYLGYWTNTGSQDSESLSAKFGSALTMDQISSSTGISKVELYKKANHWYGDYMLPSDTKYYKDGVQLSQDGFVVVYFKIVSTRGNDDYLAYNKSSGTRTETQWQVEQAGNNSYNIPKTLTNQTGGTRTPWLQSADPAYMGAAPVMIYQISQSTSQNYDTVGTH